MTTLCVCDLCNDKIPSRPRLSMMRDRETIDLCSGCFETLYDDIKLKVDARRSADALFPNTPRRG